jgi:hypothetical protein
LFFFRVPQTDFVMEHLPTPATSFPFGICGAYLLRTLVQMLARSSRLISILGPPCAKD